LYSGVSGCSVSLEAKRPGGKEGVMPRIRTLAIVGVVLAAFILVPGSSAIGNGVPDGNGHPNVGLLAVGFEEDGEIVRFGVCSGSYGGPRAGHPAQKVFVTAAHCVAWAPAEGITADQFWVTFAAKGGLRPTTIFDNVGYGVVPSVKQGPPRFELPPGRMFSTSLFKGLTQAYLKLNMNSEIEGNGGSCFGDSGSPKFMHGTNTVVALTFGGDPICRAENINSRLDIAEARAFYGQYLALP
jgi:hypothetical protein